ncbi:MAG: TolC family protein [Burkholderiales bacterium]|nr:TolC family protein [Burkholderiales bacterium]
MRRGIVAACLPLWLTGCATFSEDHGFAAVQAHTRAQLGKEVRWVRDEAAQKQLAEEIRQRLAAPLAMDDAVQIALLNNPGLQATYAELGIAEANLVAAGRLRNPGFTFTRLTHGDGDDQGVAIERKFLFDLLGLLTLPVRTALEERRFAQTQQRVSQEVLRLAWQTRRAWIEAVAAEQAVRQLEQAREAADAAGMLASRMAAVGNISRLDQMRYHSFYAETAASLARARQLAQSKREKLARLMGLWGDALSFRLPEQLPDLPSITDAEQDLEAKALRERLDVAMARREVEGLAQSLGLTRATRFVNVLEASYLRNTATGASRETGYEIELTIPLFDFGEAKVARAEAIYLQAVNRLAEIAVNARSEVREAYAAYRTAYDLARHYTEEVLPLRKRILEEMLLRYNGMLISVFELLADARSQVATVQAAIEAQRDFWLAQVDLEAARRGGGVRGVAFNPATSAPEADKH